MSTAKDGIDVMVHKPVNEDDRGVRARAELVHAVCAGENKVPDMCGTMAKRVCLCGDASAPGPYDIHLRKREIRAYHTACIDRGALTLLGGDTLTERAIVHFLLERGFIRGGDKLSRLDVTVLAPGYAIGTDRLPVNVIVEPQRMREAYNDLVRRSRDSIAMLCRRCVVLRPAPPSRSVSADAVRMMRGRLGQNGCAVGNAVTQADGTVLLDVDDVNGNCGRMDGLEAHPWFNARRGSTGFIFLSDQRFIVPPFWMLR